MQKTKEYPVIMGHHPGLSEDQHEVMGWLNAGQQQCCLVLLC